MDKVTRLKLEQLKSNDLAIEDPFLRRSSIGYCIGVQGVFSSSELHTNLSVLKDIHEEPRITRGLFIRGFIRGTIMSGSMIGIEPIERNLHWLIENLPQYSESIFMNEKEIKELLPPMQELKNKGFLNPVTKILYKSGMKTTILKDLCG